MLVLFEGWDASARRLYQAPRRAPGPAPRPVAQFAAPTYDEKRHHFMRRFSSTLPGLGGMAVLDRSWYGRVLVERVEGFATQEQWGARLRRDPQLRGEPGRRGHDRHQVLAAHLARGAAQALQVAREGPAAQLEADGRRLAQPQEAQEYTQAVEDMIARCDHPAARWHLVEAENKRWARVKVVETVCHPDRGGDAHARARAAEGRHRPRGQALRVAGHRRAGHRPAPAGEARAVGDQAPRMSRPGRTTHRRSPSPAQREQRDRT